MNVPSLPSRIAAVVSSCRTVLLIGDVDTGKTTLAASLVSAAIEAGRHAAIIDADIGQSTIGPPATVGMAMPLTPFSPAAAPGPDALAFVGATSASSAATCHIDATRNMVTEARVRGADFVVVDTTGFVRGRAAQRLKRLKAEAVDPDCIVVLERADECAGIVAAIGTGSNVRIERWTTPRGVLRKPASMRTANRERRLRAALAGSVPHRFALAEAPWHGGWLFAGAARAPAEVQRVTQILGTRVLHAEALLSHINVVTDVPVPPAALAGLSAAFHPQRVTVTPAAWYNNLLVGLLDARGGLLNIGLCQGIDFDERVATVMASFEAGAQVRSIRSGLMRVTREGRELGHLRQGHV